MDIDDIRKAFPGYHVDISLYPSGGDIVLLGCEECGTEEGEMLVGSWRNRNDTTISDAMKKLADDLNLA